MKNIIKILTLMLIIFSNFAMADGLQKLVIGIRFNDQPYTSIDSLGYAQGFDISFTQLICQQMQVQCSYQPMYFSQLFTAISQQTIDAAVGGIIPTLEREQKYNFSLPYLPSSARFIGLKQENIPEIKQITPDILQNKIVGVQTGTIYKEYIQENYPNTQIKEYLSSPELIQALTNKQIDYTIMDILAAEYWVNQAYHNLYLVGLPVKLDFNIAIMLNKNNPELLAQINNAILVVTKSPEFANLIVTFFHGYDKRNYNLLFKTPLNFYGQLGIN